MQHPQLLRGRVVVLAMLSAPIAAGAAESQPELIAFDDTANGVFYVAVGNPTAKTFIAATSSHPAWSPDGTRLAFIKYVNNGTVSMLTIVDRGANVLQSINVGKAQSPAWSPDATEIAYGCNFPPSIGIDGVCIINLASEESRVVWAETEDDIWAFNTSSLSWASTNAAIAMTVEHKVPCADPEATYTCRRLQVGATTPTGGFELLTDPASSGASGAYSPDGLKLAYYDRALGVRVASADGGGPTTIVPLEHAIIGAGYTVSDVAWSPDGAEILWSTTTDGAQSGNADFFSVSADGLGPYTHRVKDNNSSEDASWAPSIPACTVPGTPADDDPLDGTDGGDVICGDSGNDVIDGKAGDDQIFGGTGNDEILGGDGEDTIDAGAGDDAIAALDGEVDNITCGLGNDEVFADSDDTVDDDCESVDRGGSPLCGDASGDGTLSASDALVTLRSAVGSAPCEDCVCDVNGSGTVNASDALAVLRAGVGQPVVFNCEDC